MHALHLSVHMQDTGAPFTIDSQTVYLRGTLTLVSADNLASNLIAGYKSLTSAFRKCRTCMATATDMQTKVGTYNCLAFYVHITIIIVSR